MSARKAPVPDLEREDVEKAAQPGWCEPMLAVLTEERFSDPNWLYERKLDGERILAIRDQDRVRRLLG